MNTYKNIHMNIRMKIKINILDKLNKRSRECAHIMSSTFGQFWTPHPPLNHQDHHDTIQIIKICFSIIIRNIFWGVVAVFKDIKA